MNLNFCIADVEVCHVNVIYGRLYIPSNCAIFIMFILGYNYFYNKDI
jgi:hypothetical protein